MRVLLQGCCQVPAAWHIVEPQRVGYSRVYYILGGDATYQDAWIQKKFEKGKLYILPTEIPYELTKNPEDPLSCLYYHFDFFPFMVDRFIELEVPKSLQHILLSLLCQIEEKSIHSAFYHETVRLLHNYILESKKLVQVNSKLTSCMELLRNQYNKPDFSIEQISAEAGYSPEHMNRLFKKHLNTTPYQYAVQMRMQDAVRLLISGMHINEITEAVGFTDVKAFSRAFKKYYGICPSKYIEYYRAIL